MPAYADAVAGQVIGQTEEGFTGPSQKHAVSPVEVVITGMSGRFPESNNIAEFATNLYDGVDMITEDARRWKPGVHGLPTRSGKLPDLAHFDSSFFSVSPRQAHTMDPQLRLLLELTYEAIIDAGLTPNDLRGRKVGVYIGVSQSESEEAWTRDPAQITGYGLTGCCRAMFPNRISYTFDFKGPSYAVDTACSSSMVALQAAWAAMKRGEIEAAIVGGSNLTLKPQTSMQFNALNMLATDGKCKAFDASGNGYVRSEAVSVILLQTPSAAQRIYAQLVHAATNTDGNKNEGVTFPSGAVQKQLLQQVYKDAGVSPNDVSYVEAHGTGTKVGDPQEVNALADVFCNGRSTPLLMGSVKSNMGHSEPASGLCSMVKVLIAMQRKELPGNLHFNTPNTEIPALNDGRIKVVSKNTPWTGGYTAINSFGFGGANVHVLLKSYERSLSAKSASNRGESIMRALSASNSQSNNQQDDTIPELDIPRIVLASGRTSEAVKTLLNGVKERATPALYGLMDRISRTSINNHPHRGYILASSDTATAQEQKIPTSKNPLYLIFSGMGSQWPACGRRLMDIPVFAKAVKRCEAALAPYGFDLMKVLTTEENTQTVAAFSAIAVVQVGLIDVLRSVGLEFDGVVGHSVGELGCAYAVGALTAEQTVLSAFWRGRAVQEAQMPPGAMAAVGLGVEEAEKYCRDGVVVACHNSNKSVTISGPKEALHSIVEQLTAEGIFARAVQSEGIAFHHPSLQGAAPRLLKELTNLIPHPVSRGSKWMSSSVPESEWDTPRAKTASPQYLVSNLLSPVLFAEAIEKLPSEATLVEVSPHGLLQAILKRSMPQATSIPLIRKDAKDTVAHLLEALGKIHMSGEQLNIGALYPASPSPVPLSTPSLADLIRWEHNVEWDVASFSSSPGGSEFQVKIDLDTDDDAYLEGHTIDGRVIFPATGYMVLAWRALCLLTGQQWEETPVTFNNITLHQATVLASSATNRNTVTFTVRILMAKGEFEVVVGDSVAASGKIQVGVTDQKEKVYLNTLIQKRVSDDTKDNELNLKKQDVYKELRLRGYHYGGLFQGITEADLKGSNGSLSWKENWVSFLDTLLQFSLLSAKTRGLMLPTRIRKISVDPAAFHESLAQTGDANDNGVKVWHNTNIGVTVCNGIVIEGMKATMAPRRPVQDRPLLEHYTFVPLTLTKGHPMSKHLNKEDAITILTSLVVENSKSHKLKIIENLSDISTVSDRNEVVNITRSLDTHPTLQVDCTLLTPQKITEEEADLFNSLNISVKNTSLESGLSTPPHLLVLHQNLKQELISKLDDDTFILVDNQDIANQLLVESFIPIASIEIFNLILLRKKRNTSSSNEVLKVEGKGFEWVEALKSKMSEDKNSPLWLLSSNQGISGLLGMTNCLRREPGGGRVRCLMSLESEQTLNEELVSRDLAINVYQDGSWGTYRHQPLPAPKPKPTSNALLNVANRGDLASLTWFQMPPVEDDLKLGSEILCHINYAPLNFRDVMLATGKLPPDALPGDLAMKECILGLEFVGTSNDERVMGLVAAGGLATSVKGDPLLTWKVPKSWKMQEAATVPVVYATAYYALVLRGGLKSGETVLIHAGSGGVGQAAISIALARGCTVYTTVSSKEKRMVLQKRFPQLKEENFSNSRDGSFEYDILERTGGRGVDIVLNSLAGDLLQASVRCLKEHGRFLEIGKADLANNSALGMAIFLKNVTFHGILLDSLFDGPTEKRQELNKIVADGLINGEVTPLPYTEFSRDQVEEAFRFMATGKHIGKVVLEICPEGKDNTLSTKSMEAMPRINANPHMVYLITGGLGGLGLELADWLIVRGATKLVLTSRRGVTTGYQALRMKKWREQGVYVNVLCQDASTTASAEKLLKEAQKMGPIGGIFHLAMVLKDSMLENQSVELFNSVNTVKGDGAVALDIVSRRLCPQLHMWVTFSSVACGKGNAGQTNYGWANSVSERVVESRVAAGLPGVAIQWGGIGDVGVLAETLGDVEVGGTKPQSLRSVLECLDRLLQGDNTIVSSVCVASKNKDSKSGGASLVKAIANVLGVKDMSTAPMEVSLGDLGLDSLMSVEVKNILEREMAIVLSTAQVRELTLSRLQEIEKNGAEEVSNANAAQPEKDSHEQSKSENRIVMNYPALSLPLIPEVSIKILKKEGSLNPLFIASQIHGSADPLMEVVKGLDRKVYGMQYHTDIPHSSIQDMAQELAQLVVKTEPSEDLTIGGYSFGTAVALEVTTILKSMGRNVNSVVLLDGSQSYVSGIIQGHTSRYSSKSSKNSANKKSEQSDGLVFFALQFADVEAATLRKSLMALSSWEERLNLVAEVVVQNRSKHRGPDSVPDQRMVKEAKLAAELFYRRLEAGFQHEYKKSVDCPVLLIKARDNLQARALGNDYGLKKVVNGSLEVVEVPGTHESFIMGESGKKVTGYMNNFLKH
ncbi:unnamed protein product [Meganyctiphanes norvegica]|uniref:Fatty acid synthase n=1 Tax=Meganyctiphanes norvegica TaxID=48144 RepID=A0AAV2RXJ3_MEGNR